MMMTMMMVMMMMAMMMMMMTMMMMMMMTTTMMMMMMTMTSHYNCSLSLKAVRSPWSLLVYRLEKKGVAMEEKERKTRTSCVTSIYTCTAVPVRKGTVLLMTSCGIPSRTYHLKPNNTRNVSMVLYIPTSTPDLKKILAQVRRPKRKKEQKGK